MDRKQHISKVVNHRSDDLRRSSMKKYPVPRSSTIDDEQDPYLARRQRFLNQGYGGAGLDRIQHILTKNLKNSQDANEILKLIPDVEMMITIRVSSILSPKDLTEVKLTIQGHKASPPNFTEIVREYFTTEYNYEAMMADLIRESHCLYGSKLLVPMPPSVLDKYIQNDGVSMEGYGTLEMDNIFRPNSGFLYLGDNVDKDDGKFTLQSANHDVLAGKFDEVSITDSAGNEIKIGKDTIPMLQGKVEIVDNAINLSIPTIRKETALKRAANLAENYYGTKHQVNTNKYQDRNLYTRKVYQNVPIRELDVNEIVTDNNGIKPIVFEWRHDCVMPVSIAGKPEQHIGWFVVVDDQYNPLTPRDDNNFFKQLNDRLKATSGNTGDNSGNYNVRYVDGTMTEHNDYIQPLLDFYVKSVEDELKLAVERGVHNGKVDITAPDNLYRLMFMRQCKNERTKLVYIPSCLGTYYAFDYDDKGIGVSLMEKTKLYASLRAINLFGDLMAGIRNSVPLRKFNITLDEVDPDQEGTIEMAAGMLASLQSNSALPLNRFNPTDLFDSINRSGWVFDIDGGETFPGTKLETSEESRNFSKPDSDLQDNLKKMHCAGFGVTPEQLDRAFEGDFATGIVTSNLLQAKQVLVEQKIFIELSNDFIRKYIYAGGPLYTYLKDAYDNRPKLSEAELKANPDVKEPTFEELIDALTVVLPKPDTAKLAAQLETLQTFMAFLDAVLIYYIDENTIKDLAPDADIIPGGYTAVREAVRSQLIRDYMRRENMMPEIEEMLFNDDTPPWTITNSYMDKILDVVYEMIKHGGQITLIKDKKIKELNELILNSEGDDENSSSSNSGGSSGSGGSDNDSGDSGSDALDDDFEAAMGGGDEPAGESSVDALGPDPNAPDEEPAEPQQNEPAEGQGPQEE